MSDDYAADLMSRVDAFMRARLAAIAAAVRQLYAADPTLRLRDMERITHGGYWPLTDGTSVDTEIAVRGVVWWRLSVVRESYSVSLREEWLPPPAEPEAT